MLTIRFAQMKAFEVSARDQFVNALTAHLSRDWPHLSGPAFRGEVAAIVERAIGHGFSDKGHIATWAGLECRYGSGFENQVSFAVVREILDLEVAPATKLYKIDRRLHQDVETV